MALDYMTELEQRFHLSPAGGEGALFSISCEDMLAPAQLNRFLSFYARCIKATGLQPAATYFCSWFGYVAMAQQYLLSVTNRNLDLSLANLAVHVHASETTHRLAFQVKRGLEQPLPESGAERAKSCMQALATLYGDTVRPLFEAVSAAAGLHVNQLWGQLPARFHVFRQMLLAEVAEPHLKARIIEDFHTLAHHLPPAVFGRKKNPFAIKLRMVEDAVDPERQVPLKTACCLHYLTEGGRYCYNCPRLREEERKAWRERLREKT